MSGESAITFKKNRVAELRKIAELNYEHRKLCICMMDLEPHVVVEREGSVVSDIGFDLNDEAYVFVHAAGKWNNVALVYSDEHGWEFEL